MNYKELPSYERERINNLINEDFTEGEILTDDIEGWWYLTDEGVSINIKKG